MHNAPALLLPADLLDRAGITAPELQARIEPLAGSRHQAMGDSATHPPGTGTQNKKSPRPG